MMHRKAAAVVMGMALAAVLACQASAAGWEHNDSGKYWYRLDNGDFYRSSVQNINGANYAFDAAGYMQTGWNNIGGYWYYFDPASGAQRTGWVEDGGKWFFLDETAGNMRTGWISNGGSWYYMDPGSGSMYTGWLDLNGERYYLNGKGVLQTGTFQPDPGDPLRSYKFTADSAGRIVRNVTLKDPYNEDRYVTYDSEGKAMYTSNISREIAEYTGEDEWKYMRQGERGKAAVELEAAQMYDTEDATVLADAYYEGLDGVDESDKKALKNYKAQWEATVQSRFTGKYSKECIDKYIHDVEKSKYY